VWISGTVADGDTSHLAIVEPYGSTVTVRLLGAGATTFHAVEAGAWAPVDADRVSVGQAVCVEALLTERTILALRVFLGASCGPS
jgi:hypothetical protein